MTLELSGLTRPKGLAVEPPARASMAKAKEERILNARRSRRLCLSVEYEEAGRMKTNKGSRSEREVTISCTESECG